MCFLKSIKLKSFTSVLSIVMFPLVGSKNRLINAAIVDFPEPVFPVIARVFPSSILKLTLLSALIPLSG